MTISPNIPIDVGRHLGAERDAAATDNDDDRGREGTMMAAIMYAPLDTQ